MRRTAFVLLLLCLALPAAAAAQSNPFGPLPQPAAPEVTAEPVEDPADQSGISTSVLFAIAAGVLIVFVGIGLYITRDARSHLTEDDRRAIEAERVADGVETERKRSQQARKKAREKTRAQKQARKKQRR